MPANKHCAFFFSFLLLCFGTVAQATLPIVAPGATVNLSGTTAAACPEVGGVVVRDVLIPFEVVHSFTGEVLLTGALQDRVVRNSTGQMVLAPRLRDLANPNGVAWIDGMRISGYDGITVSAEYGTDGLGDIGPNRVTRSAGTGDQLFFSHGSNIIVPPDDQRFVTILTDKTEYTLTGTVEIFVSNDFGGGGFKTTIEGTAAPLSRHHVRPGESIQAAIDAASEGETVHVGAGTYNESITLRSGISVIGEDPCTTIIDGGGAARVVSLFQISDAEFSGFTVTGSGNANTDVGIWVSGGDPVVRNNKVHGNRNGIQLGFGTNALVCGNRVYDNGTFGAVDEGISVVSSTPLVSNNYIYRNPIGLYVGQAASNGARAINNTVVENSEGIRCERSSPMVKNNICANNTQVGVRAFFGNATPQLTYNNVWGNPTDYIASSTGVATPGTGSIGADPEFDLTVPDEFSLLATSPCIDAGDPSPFYDDIDGTRNDIGATGGPCGASAPPSPFARTSGFLFTSVGTIPTSDIPRSGANAGLADHGTFHDAPFGGTLWLYGGFGFNDDDAALYSIHVTPPSGPTFSLSDPLEKVRWTLSGGAWVPVEVSLGPEEHGGVWYYRRTRNGGGEIWAHENVMVKWNTGDRNGLYEIELRAYEDDGTPLPLLTETLKLRIDNTAPNAELRNVARADGTPVPECAIIRLTSGASEPLQFDFDASHANGFLHSYALQARAVSKPVLDSDRYLGVHDSPGPVWPGVTGRVVTTAPAAGWESCAYEFRLTATARTTNGFTRVRSTRDTKNYAIDLGGLCAPDFDDDGDVDGDDLAIFASQFGNAQQ